MFRVPSWRRPAGGSAGDPSPGSRRSSRYRPGVRVAYEYLDDADEALRRVRELSPATVVFDVEPLVAYWDTDDATLAAGLEHVLRELWSASAIHAIGFSTNSSRWCSVADIMIDGVRVGDHERQVFYLASARKPLNIAAYRDLPHPGIVVGDQIATDGALARRLGYSFLHYRPRYAAPPGPRMMGLIGRPLRRALFTPQAPDRSAGTSTGTDAPG